MSKKDAEGKELQVQIHRKTAEQDKDNT